MAQFKKRLGSRSRSFGSDRGGFDRDKSDRKGSSDWGGSDRGSSDRGGFKSKNRDRDREPKQLYDAECGDCNKRCKVPFKPTGSHPVFCSDCFRNKDEAGSNYNPKKFLGSSNSSSYSAKPSFASNESRVSAAPSVTKEQFYALEKKVDAILNFLHSQKRNVVAEEMVTEKKEIKKVVKKEATKAVKPKAAAKTTVKKPIKKEVKKVTKKIVKKSK